MIKILFVAILNCCILPLYAQYSFFEPKESFAIEVSLQNSTLERLPMYRNSISSLTVINDYIIGGTSAGKGLTPFVFVASLSKRSLTGFQDINSVITGQQSIQSGFCQGKNNTLFAGTIANAINDSTNGDGHLIEIKVDNKGTTVTRDLGTIAAGEGVSCLTINAKGTVLYGISLPSGLFFTYDIEKGKVRTFKDISPSKKSLNTLAEYVLKPEDYICRALIIDNQGMVYGSTPINNVFYFDPQNDSFHIIKDNLPEVWGTRALGQVESWAKSPQGKLYGGNAGAGQLFEVDPAGKKLKNLGKPIMMNRLRGLTYGRDGKLYGIAGASPGYAHLFSYDAAGEGFLDLGNPQFKMVAPGIEQGIDWRGFQLRTITSTPDGKYIIMGEDEALSQLLVFAVDTK